MTAITPSLWVGSLDDAFCDATIIHVTHILNATLKESRLLAASELDLLPRVNHVSAKYGVADDDPNADIRSILP